MHHAERSTKHAGYDGIATSGHWAQGIVVKNPDASWVEMENFCLLSAVCCLMLARTAAINESFAFNRG